jgi:hypothetical protein
MINKKLRENWLKILDFNSNFNQGDKSKLTEKKIRIPLTPIEINPYLLHYLFEILYPQFINSQQNILDIIISDDGRNILKLYLYKTKKAGIHESLETLPIDDIKLHKKDFDEIDKFYNRILQGLIKKKRGRVSSIRIFKEQAISYINQYCLDIEDLPLDVLLIRFLDLIQKLIEKNLFIIYPEPQIFSLLKDIINFLSGYNLNNLFKIIYSYLPEFNISFIFGSETITFILHLQKIFISKSENPYLRIKLLIPENVGINIAGFSENEILELVNERLQTDQSYFIYQNDVISLLTEISNQSVNIKKENLLLIIQKLLFGYRSFEKHWFLKPKPLIYNNVPRFLTRLLGFNVNLRKISHWGIPELISTLFDSWFGLNSRILVILTDDKQSKNLNLKNFDYLEYVSEYILLFEVENKTLLHIHSINKKELFNNNREIESLESIRHSLSEKFGFLSNIIIIDRQLVKDFIKHFIFEQSKYSPLSKIKTLKMLKKQKFFYLFPELPPYKLLKKKGTLSFLKLVLPILIDKHEF